MMQASKLIWHGAGMPEQKYPVIDAADRCILCGDEIDGPAVEARRIVKSTTVGDSTLLRFRASRHFCIPCAWLMEIGKGRPGNFIATPDRFEPAVISLESIVQDKRPWLRIIEDLTQYPLQTLVTGVLTTDVKVRLWHRCQMASIGQFGLYIHAPDYDVSEWRQFDLHDLAGTIQLVRDLLLQGYSKSTIYHGLPNDYRRFSANPRAAVIAERGLQSLRQTPHFLPALLMAGVTKEEKRAHANAARHADTTATDRGETDQAQLGLF